MMSLSFALRGSNMTDFADHIAQQGFLSGPGSLEAFREWLSSSLFPIDGAGHDVQTGGEVAQHGA